MRAASLLNFRKRSQRPGGARLGLLLTSVACLSAGPHLLAIGGNAAAASALGLGSGALLTAAAALAAQRLRARLQSATGLASRFAAGETHLRLEPNSRFAEFNELFAILNSIADTVEDRELQLALLSEATGDLVWDWDLASDFVTCRGGATKAIGLPDDTFKLCNDWWIERVHPDQRADILRSFEQAFGSPTRLWSEEYQFRHEDGTYRWFWDRGVIVRTAAGKPARVIGCMTDISGRKSAEDMLKASERRYRSLAIATSSIVWSASCDGEIMAPHAAWERFTGQTASEYSGLGWLDAFHPHDKERVLEGWREGLRTKQAFTISARVRTRHGAFRWITSRAVPVLDASGQPVEWVGVIVDIHDEHQARLELVQKTTDLGERVKELNCLHAIAVACNQDDLATGEILSKAAQAIPLALLHPGCAVCEIEWNGALVSSSGATASGLNANLTVPIFADGQPVGSIHIGYRGQAAGEQPLAEEMAMLKTVAALLGQTIAQRADRRRILHTAQHDALTGLPNRLTFQERLQSLFQEGPEGAPLALLLIDLDHFKDVNDTLGHDAGDALLAGMAGRIEETIAERGIVARLGGDEFAVILPGQDSAGTEAIAFELVDRLRMPVHFAGRDISTRATIGLATSPKDGRTPAELLKSADIALYSGKSTGRNACVPYQSSMRETIETRVTVCAEVRQSLGIEAFVPYYQPKVALDGNYIRGFEALLRWRHPTRGLLTAGAALPAFEDHELAVALGDQLRSQVFRDMSEWRRQGVEFHQVAINLSSAEFKRADLADRILGELKSAGLSTGSLAIEVTETVLLGREADLIGSILQKLHTAGVQIALDDFGTGFASLTHLQRYPVNIIKIDQSFVRSIMTDKGSQAITSAVLELGRRLGMTVVAEGVETAEQAELLRTAGCDEAQGFYFAKAMPASRVPYILGGSERLQWAAASLRKRPNAA